VAVRAGDHDGFAAGTAIALAVAQVGHARLDSFLDQVSPRDPAVYGPVIAILATITLVSRWLPARRATKVNPMVALRAE